MCIRDRGKAEGAGLCQEAGYQEERVADHRDDCHDGHQLFARTFAGNSRVEDHQKCGCGHADHCEQGISVSYTHLDVYKRQGLSTFEIKKAYPALLSNGEKDQDSCGTCLLYTSEFLTAWAVCDRSDGDSGGDYDFDDGGIINE